MAEDTIPGVRLPKQIETMPSVIFLDLIENGPGISWIPPEISIGLESMWQLLIFTTHGTTGPPR